MLTKLIVLAYYQKQRYKKNLIKKAFLKKYHERYIFEHEPLSE